MEEGEDSPVAGEGEEDLVVGELSFEKRKFSKENQFEI